MIDTCHLKFRIVIPEWMLGFHWKRRTLERSDGSIKVWYVRNEYVNGARIRLVYYPLSYITDSLLVIQISSITQLIYGSNIIFFHAVEEIIQVVNAILAQILPGLKIDFGQGILERIDLFQDYFVGEYMDDYIQAISQLIYPHRTRCVFQNPPRRQTQSKDNGVWFKSKDTICKFYDKWLESGDLRAYGLLRHECELRDTDKIAIATGLLEPSLHGINQLIVFNILKKDLVRLGLWRSTISGEDFYNEKLSLRYTPKQAKRLSNILRDIHDHPMMSKTDLANRLGIQIPTLNKSLREIKVAGIAVGSVDGEKILPPLDLRIHDDSGYEIVTKGASDTELPLSIVTQDEIALLNGVIK